MTVHNPPASSGAPLVLKPCPFCGGDMNFYNIFGQGMGPLKTYTVKCFKCFIETRREDTPLEAIAAWNRRPTEGKERGD